MAARKEHSHKLLTALIAGSAVALALGALQSGGGLRLMELKTYDMRMKAALPPSTRPGEKPRIAHPGIVVLTISDESIEWMKENRQIAWPWDRRQFARLFQACSQEDYPATCILFDFFTLLDPDPYKGEEELIRSLKGPTPVYVSVPFKSESGKLADRRPGLEGLLQRYAIDVTHDGSVELKERSRSVLFPVPGVAEAVAGVCDVETEEEADGITRRYQVLSRFRGRYYPSFVLAALMEREKVRKAEIRDRVITVGRASIPVERDGTILLKYYTAVGDSFTILTAPNVLSGLDTLEKGKVTKFDPSLVQDKIVLLGSDAAALYDLKVTPVTEAMPGVEIHAIALANVLNGETMRTPGPAVPLALLAGLALLTCGITRFTGPAAGGAAAAAILLATVWINVALFRARWAVDLVGPLLAVGVGYAVTSGLNFFTEGRQRLRVKREFQRYFSPKVVEKILKKADSVNVQGERKPLTIFFMDFAGFTSMSERLDPAELVKLISEYHNEAAEEIFRTEGTIDKYIGDAIMAFWNDPIEQADHALRACLSAVAAQKRLRQMAVQMKERGLPEMRARIGINSGVATVGDMGARNQVGYTAIGDEVNLASRLEGVNKEFGTEIIVSETTYLPAKERLEVRELALIKVKGKKMPVRIYELLGAKGEIPADRIDRARRFERALGDLRSRRFGEARDAFAALAAEGDLPSQSYVELCDEYRAESPTPDWDGSYTMKTK